jgi:serine/threonine protein kinase
VHRDLKPENVFLVPDDDGRSPRSSISAWPSGTPIGPSTTSPRRGSSSVRRFT